MKKKAIDEAINGILLAVVTINAFVDFLPKSVATALGVLILCKILYQYLPAITRKLYETSEGTFTEKWWIRLLILCFAVPGYFTFLSQYDYFVLFILIVAAFTLAFPLAYAWNKENKDRPPDQQSFWKDMARGQRKNLDEEWEKYKKSPNKLSTFCWYYAPGLYLSGMGVFFFGIFFLFSLYSQLFTLLSIGYLLANVFPKFGCRNESIDKELLKLPSVIKGWKGAFGFMCIFAGFAFSGTFIFQYLLHLPPNLLDLLGLPPFLYQFVFWYSILRRFPYFLRYWQNGQRDKTLSLPTGQIYAFIGSCISPFYIFIVSASPLFKLLYRFHLHQFYYHLLLLLWFLIDFIFVALIAHTIIKWRREKRLEELYLDNVRIPLVLFIQSTFLSFGTAYVIEKSFLSELSLISSLLVMVMIILFFIDDWQNFLKHRYGDGLTSEILSILPVFGILTLLNLITFVWLQPIFYLGLALSIIVVSFIVVDISINYGMLCCAQLHKFYVLLTNEIVKALNFIKERCNHLFLALKRKEVINNVINGILLAVVTINTFISFLPKYVAITLGVLTLCKLLYKYLPATIGKLYGDFAKQWTVISYFMFCAIPGYITPLNPYLGEFFFITVFIGAFVLSSLLNDAYHIYEANKGVELQDRKYYKVMPRVIGKVVGGEEYQLKWWERYKNLPDSTTKKIILYLILSLPGLYLWFLGLLIFGIFLLFSIYSLLFALVLIGWLLTMLLKHALPKFKQWNEKKPDIERELLKLASFKSPKGLCSILTLFMAFLITGDYISFLLSTYIPSSPINFPYLFLVFPPFLYRFIFWYSFLRRLPSFIHYWEDGSSRSTNYVLPTGGLYAFIASCIYATFFPSFFNSRELIYLLLLLLMGFVYIFLILHTIKKWRTKETLGNVYRDNLRIPLALFIQLMSYLLFYKYKLEYPIPEASPLLYLILFLSLTVVFLILFFIPDWLRFLDRKYATNPPLRVYILFLLPLFVLLFLGNFVMSVLWEEGSMFLTFVSLFLIVVVFVLLLATGLQISINRKKQLSRAKESRKANSINAKAKK